MKPVPVGLAAHYAGGTTTLARCWKITRTDGVVFGFTSADADLRIDGVLYEAASGGFTPSAIDGTADLSVDGLDARGFIDSATITEPDLRAGLWDSAFVEIFEVNYRNPGAGVLTLRTGWLGQVKTTAADFVAELRGLTQKLQQTVGRSVAAGCDADLGDVRCKVSLAAWTVAGAITAVASPARFTDSSRTEDADHFGGGRLAWLTGANAGLHVEVKAFETGAFDLALPTPYPMAVGDTYSVYAGCRKRFTEDCVGKFANAVNFRGHPHVPGVDKTVGLGAMEIPE